MLQTCYWAWNGTDMQLGLERPWTWLITPDDGQMVQRTPPTKGRCCVTSLRLVSRHTGQKGGRIPRIIFNSSKKFVKSIKFRSRPSGKSLVKSL